MTVVGVPGGEAEGPGLEIMGSSDPGRKMWAAAEKGEPRPPCRSVTALVNEVKHNCG